MSFEKKVQESFKKAKDDAEGIKNEIAFLARRIAKIEESMIRKTVEENSKKRKAKKKKL
jgi:hypothetical protein